MTREETIRRVVLGVFWLIFVLAALNILSR